MRDHELELIAALVEGRLEDETEARALVASAPEYREEYETQKLAYETLQLAGTAALTESERATLHREVWTSLRSEAASKPARAPWYYRWAPVAAGLFVVVGLVAILSQTGGGEDGAIESADLAADLPVETTTASDGALEDEGQDSLGESGGVTDTTAAASEEPPATTSAEASTSDEDVDMYAREAEMLRQGVFGARSQAYEESSAADDTVETCVEDAGLSDYRVIATLTPPSEETEVAVAYPEEVELTTAPIAFVSLDTCALLYLDE